MDLFKPKQWATKSDLYGRGRSIKPAQKGLRDERLKGAALSAV
jgi:hypothetical protein